MPITTTILTAGISNEMKIHFISEHFGHIFLEINPKKLICSNEYTMHKLIISLYRKIVIQQKDPSQISESLSTVKDMLYNYINSEEFKLLYRRTNKSLESESNQIEKDNRLFEKQVKDRQKNLKEKKDNLSNMITSILSSAGLPDDFLEGESTELIE